MYQTKKTRPVNSLIFVSDRSGGDSPKPVRDAQIQSTSSCISIACYPEQDGATTVTLGDMQDVDPGRPASFEGELAAPSRSVVVSTSDRKTILEKQVGGQSIKIRVWVNHPKWANEIVIGVE
jgi:hypothetical protein